ncbi:MAG TPA: hypothetical protein PKW59_12490 [Thermotogota bacterium]|nr:hypothetical protein [Thermotogota bacterium]
MAVKRFPVAGRFAVLQSDNDFSYKYRGQEVTLKAGQYAIEFTEDFEVEETAFKGFTDAVFFSVIVA